MATRKRKEPSSSLETSGKKEAKWKVSKETFQKWQRTYEKEHQTLSWLRTEMDCENKFLVSTLWCVDCRQYEAKVCGHKSFSSVRIDGSSNHKTSNVTDHAKSEPHKAAMMCFKRDQAKNRNEPITSYSAIAQSLLSTSMD